MADDLDALGDAIGRAVSHAITDAHGDAHCIPYVYCPVCYPDSTLADTIPHG